MRYTAIDMIIISEMCVHLNSTRLLYVRRAQSGNMGQNAHMRVLPLLILAFLPHTFDFQISPFTEHTILSLTLKNCTTAKYINLSTMYSDLYNI